MLSAFPELAGDFVWRQGIAGMPLGKVNLVGELSAISQFDGYPI